MVDILVEKMTYAPIFGQDLHPFLQMVIQSLINIKLLVAGTVLRALGYTPVEKNRQKFQFP